MTNIIKRSGKFYRQTIQEDEVHLENLEETLLEVMDRKKKTLAQQKEDYDNQIAEIQDEINQINTL